MTCCYGWYCIWSPGSYCPLCPYCSRHSAAPGDRTKKNCHASYQAPTVGVMNTVQCSIFENFFAVCQCVRYNILLVDHIFGFFGHNLDNVRSCIWLAKRYSCTYRGCRKNVFFFKNFQYSTSFSLASTGPLLLVVQRTLKMFCSGI